MSATAPKRANKEVAERRNLNRGLQGVRLRRGWVREKGRRNERAAGSEKGVEAASRKAKSESKQAGGHRKILDWTRGRVGRQKGLEERQGSEWQKME